MRAPLADPQEKVIGKTDKDHRVGDDEDLEGVRWPVEEEQSVKQNRQDDCAGDAKQVEIDPQEGRYSLDAGPEWVDLIFCPSLVPVFAIRLNFKNQGKRRAGQTQTR